MASFEVRFKPSVDKDFLSLPKTVIGRVLKRIDSLTKDPVPRQAKKLHSSERLYRIRVGDYRIIYKVDTRARRIVIQHVRHRREVYRGY